MVIYDPIFLILCFIRKSESLMYMHTTGLLNDTMTAQSLDRLARVTEFRQDLLRVLSQ